VTTTDPGAAWPALTARGLGKAFGPKIAVAEVNIDFASGYRSTALLLAGWLAGQLNWTLEKTSTLDTLDFRTEADATELMAPTLTSDSRVIVPFDSIFQPMIVSAPVENIRTGVTSCVPPRLSTVAADKVTMVSGAVTSPVS